MSSYDSPWKEALDLFLHLLLQFLFPDVEADIDWTQDYESLEQELRQIAPEGEVGLRLADKLIKVRTLSGDERILHLEVQAQPRKEFERRAYVYHYRGDDRFGVPPEALVILADDDPAWRPTTYQVRLKRTRLTFEFQPAKLLDWANRQEELRDHENPMGLFVLAHLEARRTRNDDERARVKLDLLSRLRARKLDDQEMRQWYRFLDWFLDLPRERDIEVYRQARTQAQESKMPFVTFADRYERELAFLQGLEALLEAKFGEPGLALMDDLRKVEDDKRLEAILQAARKATSPDDIRALIAKPPPDAA
jgi:hypothetical protein